MIRQIFCFGATEEKEKGSEDLDPVCWGPARHGGQKPSQSICPPARREIGRQPTATFGTDFPGVSACQPQACSDSARDKAWHDVYQRCFRTYGEHACALSCASSCRLSDVEHLPRAGWTEFCIARLDIPPWPAGGATWHASIPATSSKAAKSGRRASSQVVALVRRIPGFHRSARYLQHHCSTCISACSHSKPRSPKAQTEPRPCACTCVYACSLLPT